MKSIWKGTISFGLLFITARLFAAEPAPEPPSFPEQEMEIEQLSKKRAAREAGEELAESEEVAKRLKQEEEQQQQKGQASFESLPAEIKQLIVNYLVTASGATTQARLQKAAENIRNFAMVNKKYYINLNDAKTAELFIDALAERYAGRNMLEAAFALATPGAGKWLANKFNTGMATLTTITPVPPVIKFTRARFLNAIRHTLDVSTVKFMLQYIPRINEAALYPLGLTPLDLALQLGKKGNLQMVKILLDAAGTVPTLEMLNSAANANHARIVEMLAEKLMDIPGDAYSLLENALKVGSQKLADKIIAKNPQLIAQLNESQKSELLLLAAKHGIIAMVETLLAAGADINKMQRFEKHSFASPLMVASFFGQSDTVKKLLAAGANVNTQTLTGNTVGDTALIVAAQTGSIKIIEMLLNAGANVNLADVTGKTPLIIAAYHNHLTIIFLLLAAGARIDAKDNKGQTALQYAIKQGNLDMVKLLINRGASVADTLRFAVQEAEKNKEAIIKVLKENGAT